MDPLADRTNDETLPLGDIRVIEMGFGVAGPFLARNLGHFGADVIRVESARRPDSLRLGGAGWLPPEVDIAIRRDTRPAIDFSSSGKRSIGLEIDTDAGRAVFEKLIATADVFVTNLSANVLPRLRITYEDLRGIRADIIHISLTSFGSGSGPYSTYRTWGHNLTAAVGLDSQIGWPDRGPGQLAMAFPDYVSAHVGTSAALAALLRRDLTGQGCQIELSQFEMAASCLAPGLLQTQLRGADAGQPGNRLPGVCPHGIYPSRGEDRWVALSVTDEAMWGRLCRAEGLESLAHDDRFVTLASRLENEDELDEILGRWTRPRTDWEAASELQHYGVAAAPVMDSWDVLSDQHLACREFFNVLPSPRFGYDLVYGQAMALQSTPPRVHSAAPAMGQHTREVLEGLLGYAAADVDELLAAGIITEMVDSPVALERPYRHWIDKLVRLPWPPAAFDPYRIIREQLRESFTGTDASAARDSR
jgi:crotonobetainyl-CoA:carnitine CoA-transferase CaiB-like acyl-CoA transferase